MAILLGQKNSGRNNKVITGVAVRQVPLYCTPLPNLINASWL